MQQEEESLIRLSGDEIIELVRESRNELITKLLEDNALKKFLHERYLMEDVSQIKREFIRRALRELMATAVDLSHYGSLILDIRKTGSLIISKSSEKYFYEEIERVLKTYLL